MSSIIKNKLKAARSHISKKEYESAYEVSNDVLEWESENYNALIFLGIACQNLKKTKESEEAYHKAIQIDPENILAWQGISNLYEEALDVEKLLPTLAELFNLYIKLKNFKKASEIFWKELAIHKKTNSIGKQIEVWRRLLLVNLNEIVSEQVSDLLQTSAESGWPSSDVCLDVLINLIETNNAAEISREIKKRRSRLDAPPIPILTHSVIKEITINSNLLDLYEKKLLSLEGSNKILSFDILTLKNEIDILSNTDSDSDSNCLFGEKIASILHKEANVLDLYEKVFDIYTLKCVPMKVPITPDPKRDNQITAKDINTFQSIIITLVSNLRNSKAHRFFIDFLDLDYTNNIFSNSLLQYTSLFGPNEPFNNIVNIYRALQKNSNTLEDIKGSASLLHINETPDFYYGGCTFINLVKSKYYNKIEEFEKSISLHTTIANHINFVDLLFSTKLPNSSDLSLLELAHSYFSLGKSGWKKSKEIYTSLINSKDINTSIESSINACKILNLEKDYDKSLSLLNLTLQKAMDSDLPCDKKSYNVANVKGKIGEIYIKLGKISEARDIIENTLTIMPNWIEGKIALSDIYSSLFTSSGDLVYRKKSLKELIEAAKMDENSEYIFIKLGEWYFDSYKLAKENSDSEKIISNFFNKSKSCYIKAYSLNPGNHVTSKSLAKSILLDNNIPYDERVLKVVQILEQATKINKKQPWAWLQLGLINLNNYHSYSEAVTQFQNSLKNVYILQQNNEFYINSIAYEGLAESFLKCGKVLSAQQTALKAKQYLYTNLEFENFIKEFSNISQFKIEKISLSFSVDNNHLNSIWSTDELAIKKASLSFLQGEIHSFKNEYEISHFYYLEAERFALSLNEMEVQPNLKLAHSREHRHQISYDLTSRIGIKLAHNLLNFSIAKQNSGMFGSSFELLAQSLIRFSDLLEKSHLHKSNLVYAPWKLIFDSSVLLFDSVYYFGMSANFFNNITTVGQQRPNNNLLSSISSIIKYCINYFNKNVASAFSQDQEPSSGPISTVLTGDIAWLKSISEKLETGHFETFVDDLVDIPLSLATASSAMMIMISPSASTASLSWKNLANSFFLRSIARTGTHIVGSFPFYSRSYEPNDSCNDSSYISKTISYLKPSYCDLSKDSSALLSDSFFCIQASLQLSPTSIKSLHLLSKISFKLKMYKLSQHALVSSLKIDPNSSNGWLLLGNLYMVLGYFDLAIKCFNSCLGIDPDHMNATYSLAVLNLFFLNSPKSAFDLFQRCIDLGGNSKIGAVLSYCFLTWKYQSLATPNNVYLAIFELRKLCEIISDNPTCWHLLGLLAETTGEHNLSKNMFQVACECFSSNKLYAIYNFNSLIRMYTYLSMHDSLEDTQKNSILEISEGCLLNDKLTLSNDNKFKSQLFTIYNFDNILSPSNSTISESEYLSISNKVTEIFISQLQLATLHGYSRNCAAVYEYETASQIYSALLEKIEVDPILLEFESTKDFSKLSNLLSILVGFGISLVLCDKIGEGLSQFESAMAIVNNLNQLNDSFIPVKIIIDCLLSQVLWSLGSDEHKKLAYKHIFESLYTDENFVSRSLKSLNHDLLYSLAEALKVFLCFAISFNDSEAAGIALESIKKIPSCISIQSYIPFLVSVYHILVEENSSKSNRNIMKYLIANPNSREMWIQSASVYFYSSQLNSNTMEPALLSCLSAMKFNFGTNIHESSLKAENSSVQNLSKSSFSNDCYLALSNKKSYIDALLISCYAGLNLGTSLPSPPKISDTHIWCPSRYYVKNNLDSQDVSDNLNKVSISGIIESPAEITDEDENLFDVYEKIEEDASTIKKFASSNLKLAKSVMFGSHIEMSIKKSKFKAAKAVMFNPSSASTWYTLSVASYFQVLQKTNTLSTIPVTTELLLNPTSYKKKDFITSNTKNIIHLCKTTVENFVYWTPGILGLLSNDEYNIPGSLDQTSNDSLIIDTTDSIISPKTNTMISQLESIRLYLSHLLSTFNEKIIVDEFSHDINQTLNTSSNSEALLSNLFNILRSESTDLFDDILANLSKANIISLNCFSPPGLSYDIERMTISSILELSQDLESNLKQFGALYFESPENLSS
ncbi:Tetratricopeptide repeat protein 37 [Smittium culicis]|uniref:Tetratricopeptide repeat protein 37 n=1 Tax=Smittium culicis TaxID=133412 RepID=A0A1R1YGF0_9FUNG|nr:Tetratricopeptide repeat protein 37 [Smittium culicis]